MSSFFFKGRGISLVSSSCYYELNCGNARVGILYFLASVAWIWLEGGATYARKGSDS